MSRRDDEERIYAKMLLDSILPGLSIIPDKSESPDFLFAHNGKTIGIEVTELEVPSSSRSNRELESMEDFISRHAMRLAIARSLPPLSAWLFFNVTAVAPRCRWESIAEAVVDAVTNGLPAKGERIELEYPFSGQYQPREVDLIHVSRNEHAYRHIWHPVRGSWVMRKAQGLFQAAIDHKAQKYPRYREKCDECWLILGAEGTRQSSAIRPDEATITGTYKSEFERVFFVKRADGICQELKLSARHSVAG